MIGIFLLFIEILRLLMLYVWIVESKCLIVEILVLFLFNMVVILVFMMFLGFKGRFMFKLEW